MGEFLVTVSSEMLLNTIGNNVKLKFTSSSVAGKWISGVSTNRAWEAVCSVINGITMAILPHVPRRFFRVAITTSF